jgi:hypothetical protein
MEINAQKNYSDPLCAHPKFDYRIRHIRNLSKGIVDPKI